MHCVVSPKIVTHQKRIFGRFEYPPKLPLPCQRYNWQIFASCIIQMPRDWPDTLFKQRLSVDYTIHTQLGICALQVMPYKHTVMSYAVILFISDQWGFHIKGCNIIFSNWCDTIYLSGKQNHLQQDKALAMLKLFCMLFHACNKGRFDQTKTRTAVTEFLKFMLALFNRYHGVIIRGSFHK